MRILIVHNHYQDPGGEDSVVRQEMELLSATEEVSLHVSQNQKGWRGLVQTALSPWNFIAARKLKEVIRRFKPDVIHIHNLHYAIGPIAIWIAKRQKVPVVMTLHNYRLLCPSATLFHKGKPFTDSLQQNFPWRAVRLGVHSRSVVKTWWLALTTWLHKQLGTWQQVSQYIALTPFAKQLFEESTLGLSAAQISIKQNFLSSDVLEPAERQGYFLFIGRLSEEKGLRTLLRSFVDTGASLVVAGDGPLKPLVQEYSESNPNIRYVGSVGREEVDQLLRQCTAMVFPSIWYEGMPMTIIEAFATATPVIASDFGAMQAMIADGRNGLLFGPGDAESLSKKVGEWLKMDLADKLDMGKAARHEFEDKYGPETNRRLLLDIYHRAIGEAKENSATV